MLATPFGIEKKFWRNLERVRKTLGWQHYEMADALSLTTPQYASMINRREAPTVSSLYNLSMRLGLDFETLCLGQIDFVALEKHFFGDELYIPERYTIGAFSKRRTSVNVLSYLEEVIAPEIVDDLLRKCQVKRAVFHDHEAAINIHFLSDLARNLEKEGFTDEQLFRMGANTIQVNARTPMALALSKADSVREAYEIQVTQYMSHYDRNFDYQLLELSATHAVLEVAQSAELTEALKLSRIGNPYLCTIRRGVAAAVPGFMDLPLASVRETHCVHEGDPACRLHIDFSLAHHRERRRSCN